MNNKRLPKDFFFGAAMSGPQTEGSHNRDGKLPNYWDMWSDLEINKFHNNVGSYVGNDFYNKYEDDIKIMKELNFNSFRTSIQWSRLLDIDGNINPEGAAFYHRVIDFALANDIDIFINLYHFDMPEYLYKRGGWESRDVVEAFGRYARAAFLEFGDKVKHWFTFNEPIVEPMCGFHQGLWYPYEIDERKAIQTQYHITLAHCLAVNEFRELKATSAIRDDAKIGLINCFAPPYTKESPSDADLEAVRMTDGIHNRWWLDVVSKGTLPRDVLDTLSEYGIEPYIRPGDKDIVAMGIVDWLGFNYYQPSRVQAPKQKYDSKGNPIFSDPYIWKDRKMNIHRGWEIYPKGIYDFGMKIKKECPGLEFFISENGMGVEGEVKFMNKDGVIEDDYRIEFVKEHLEWVAQSIEDGANCVGYHYWGAIDNWSWMNAFKNRYGFVGVDLTDGYKRKKKKSADWISEVARTKEIK